MAAIEATNSLPNIPEYMPKKRLPPNIPVFFKTSIAPKVIESGAEYSELVKLLDFLKVTLKELSMFSGISQTTLTRRREQQKLNSKETDRLFRLAEIFQLAETVFNNREKALNWMRKPQPYLNNISALQAMKTETGTSEVENLLLAIEHGVYL